VNFVRIGDSGLKLSEITFGTALTIGTERQDYAYAQSMTDTAWALGIRSFDCANSYGHGKAEALLGAALKRYPRQEFVISTKAYWPVGDSVYHKGLSRKHILWAFENSLSNLNMDYVDLYYAHRHDPDTPMEEIVRVFNNLIGQGRIRYWATSEWSVEALSECFIVCEKLNMEKPVLEQCVFSFAVTKALTNGVAEFCRNNGVGLLGFSPLCQGLLTGKYKNDIPANSRIAKSAQLSYNKTANFYIQNKKRIDFYITACEKYGVNMPAAALRWCIRQGVYPVLGASNQKQLEENLGTFNNDISDEFWTEIDAGLAE
jgi:aryl-alcohol dehydrogenase-like predicted oxidoreductase